MQPSFPAPVVGNSVPDLNATAQVVSSSNIYLTPASYGYQNVAMTAVGLAVFLPPAYANIPGKLQYTIRNSGTYPIGVRDVNGVLLTSLTAGGTALVALDNSGLWGISGTGLQPGMVTIDALSATTLTNAILNPYVALDSNTSLHFAVLGTGGFAAFLVDNLARTLTTPVTVSAVGGVEPQAAFRISSTQAIIFFAGGNSTTHSAAVVTVTGASPALGLSVGATASINTVGAMTNWGGENFISQPRIAALTSSLYLASFTVGTDNRCVAASVTGTTVTFGVIFQFAASNASTDGTTTYAITPTTAFVLYENSSTGAIIGIVITVTGVTCTAGAPASPTSLMAPPVVPSSCQLTATKYLVFSDNNSTTARAHAATITGTTVTWGAALTVEAVVGGFGNVSPTASAGAGYSQSGASRYMPHLFPLSTTTALVNYYETGGSISRVAVLTENAGVVTAGPILYRSVAAAGTTTTDGGQLCPQGQTEFLAIKQMASSASASWKHRLIPHKISGTSITVGAAGALTNLSPDIQAQTHVSVRTANGDYILGLSSPSNTFSPAQNISVFRSNGDYLNFRGSIDVPACAGYPFSLAQAAPNRLVFIGSAQYNGTSTFASSQIRVFNVELTS